MLIVTLTIIFCVNFIAANFCNYQHFNFRSSYFPIMRLHSQIYWSSWYQHHILHYLSNKYCYRNISSTVQYLAKARNFTKVSSVDNSKMFTKSCISVKNDGKVFPCHFFVLSYVLFYLYLNIYHSYCFVFAGIGNLSSYKRHFHISSDCLWPKIHRNGTCFERSTKSNISATQNFWFWYCSSFTWCSVPNNLDHYKESTFLSWTMCGQPYNNFNDGFGLGL